MMNDRTTRSGLRLTLVLLLAFSVACSDRDRTNPLDPGNPDGNRSNLGFNALAGNNRVLLEWNPLEFDDLSGVRIQRIEVGTNDTVTVTDSSLSLSTTRIVDNTPKNGTTYTYHLRFDVEGSDEKPVTLPDTVTPGPVFTYVELIDYGEVVLFTPDFRDEVFSLETGFFDVLDIEVGASVVWVLDANGTIDRFNRNGELISSGDLINASAIAFHPWDASAWVALKGQTGLVYHFQSNGELISSKATNIPVTSLAYDRQGNDIWAGSSEPSITKIDITSNTSTQFSHSDFAKPELVVTARAPLEGGVWVGDHGSNRAMHLSSGGLLWSRAGFMEVNDLVVNNNGMRCWVADAKADEVVMLDGRTGEVIWRMSGFGNPFYLAYNAANNTVMVSGSTGLLSVLNEDGQLVFSVQNPDRTGIISLSY